MNDGHDEPADYQGVRPRRHEEIKDDQVMSDGSFHDCPDSSIISIIKERLKIETGALSAKVSIRAAEPMHFTNSQTQVVIPKEWSHLYDRRLEGKTMREARDEERKTKWNVPMATVISIKDLEQTAGDLTRELCEAMEAQCEHRNCWPTRAQAVRDAQVELYKAA